MPLLPPMLLSLTVSISQLICWADALSLSWLHYPEKKVSRHYSQRTSSNVYFPCDSSIPYILPCLPVISLTTAAGRLLFPVIPFPIRAVLTGIITCTCTRSRLAIRTKFCASRITPKCLSPIVSISVLKISIWKICRPLIQIAIRRVLQCI